MSLPPTHRERCPNKAQKILTSRSVSSVNCCYHFWEEPLNVVRGLKSPHCIWEISLRVGMEISCPSMFVQVYCLLSLRAISPTGCVIHHLIEHHISRTCEAAVRELYIERYKRNRQKIINLKMLVSLENRGYEMETPTKNLLLIMEMEIKSAKQKSEL